MSITIKQKKLIFIILSSVLLIFIFAFGINTYYKENKFPTDPISDQSADYEMIMEKARLESSLCSSSELKNQYRICCAIQGGIKEELLYNCTSQEYFEPGQRVVIIFDASRFDIPYDPYFLRINSDLNYEEGKTITNSIPGALDKGESFLVKISGIVPEEVKSFTLVKLSVYPDSTFEDQQVILYREAKIFKE